MTIKPATLTGGELNAALTSAIVGIQMRYLGRGPTTASTFHKDHVVVTLMYGVMTTAEKSLAASDNEEAVSNMRHLFQNTMEADYTEAVQQLTGRTVIAFISGNNVDPDVASELFILDGPPNIKPRSPPVNEAG